MEITGLYFPGLQARPVAVMGAFRCGTNYLSFLLEQNYRCRVREDIYGWKHSIIPPRALSHGRKLYLAPVVAIAKPPAAFLISLYKYRMSIGRNMVASAEWETFVTGRFVIFDSNIERSPRICFPNPVAYWNWLYGNLLNLPPAKFRSTHVAYDRLATAPEAECDRISERIGLKRRSGAFRLPTGRLGRRSTLAVATTTYISAQTEKMEAGIVAPAGLTPDLAAFVRDWADPEILAGFGFPSDGGHP